MHAATFDAVEYLPTAHLVQMLAPALVPVFVIEPSGHTAQALASFEPVTSTYRPAAQLVHAPTFDAVEYLPPAHAVHELAPGNDPVFVIEHAVPSIHDATFDLVEYLPALHAVHAFAPAPAPLSVVEPATHTLQ